MEKIKLHAGRLSARAGRYIDTIWKDFPRNPQKANFQGRPTTNNTSGLVLKVRSLASKSRSPIQRVRSPAMGDADSKPGKCPWSQLAPESFKMSLLGPLLLRVLEGFSKTIFRIEGTATQRTTAKPSSGTAKPSANTAKPSSKIAKPRPVHRDSTRSSKPRPGPTNPVYGDSAVSSKPSLRASEPGPPSPEPGPPSPEPNRDSPAPGAARERLWCCAGLRGFKAKPSEIAVDRCQADIKPRSRSYFADFGEKSGFQKRHFSLGFEEMAVNLREADSELRSLTRFQSI